MFDVERWMLNVQLFKLLGSFFGSAKYLWPGAEDQVVHVQKRTRVIGETFENRQFPAG
jgi:hypothetical protein